MALNQLRPLNVKPVKVKDFQKPAAMVLEGQPVLIKNLNKGGSYQQYNHLKTGELVGLREGDYFLIKKSNGDFYERTLKGGLSDKFSCYEVVTGKDGKIKSLSECTDPLKGTLKLEKGVNGEIKSTQITPIEEISNSLEHSADDIDAINAVKKYYGESPISPTELKSKAYSAVVADLLR